MRPLPALVLTASALTIAGCAPTAPQPPVAASERPPAVMVLASTSEPQEAPQPADPCHDYQALEAGQAARDRQHLFDHLRPVDYTRWRGACLYGMDGAEWECLVRKIDAESGWYELADGAGSTHGIPQANPGSKMASHGDDWYWNGRTQVRWMLDYIESRYGSEWNTPRPCRPGY